ncbi:MAG TPA: hypothetical protein VHE54_07905 [Puia sp.]|nr:hypothetical protein [Puia sp.]
MSIPKHTFSILIWQVKYRQKSGKAPLSVRVSVNGNRAGIRTNRENSPYPLGCRSPAGEGKHRGGKNPSLPISKPLHIKRITEKMKADLYLEDIKRSFIHHLEHYLFTVEHLQNNTVTK